MHPDGHRPDTITLLRQVLDVIADFDGHGGASIELAAWEFGRDPAELTDAWNIAITKRLIQPTDIDPVMGEQFHRITARGRAFLAATPTWPGDRQSDPSTTPQHADTHDQPGARRPA